MKERGEVEGEEMRVVKVSWVRICANSITGKIHDIIVKYNEYLENLSICKREIIRY